MLQKYKTKREEGFTIIEVLIVLAIAGLIILIVFLAVPALQRNSRNTSRRNDVSKVGGTIQEILNNNNGSVTSVDEGAIFAAIGSNLAYYDWDGNDDGTFDQNLDVQAGTGAAVAENDVDQITVVSNAKCTGSNGAANNVDASPRQFAIVFMVENSGSGTPVCQDV